MRCRAYSIYSYAPVTTARRSTAGFTGLEAGAEGPFAKTSKSSYLIYYRYSLLGLLGKIGLNFGTGNATPRYQDLTLKLNFPMAIGHTISVFGIAGTNGTRFDNMGSAYSDAGSYNDYRTAMGVLGATYGARLTPCTTLHLTMALTGTRVNNRYDTLGPDKNRYLNYQDNSHYVKATTHAQLTRRYTARSSLLAGAIVSAYRFSFHDSTRTRAGLRPLRNTNAPTQTYQAYVQWHYAPTHRLTLNAGLHVTQLSLTGHGVAEPRLGLQYVLTPGATLSFGLGNYSRWQDWMLYFNEQTADNQAKLLPNTALGFSKSRQLVLGWT